MNPASELSTTSDVDAEDETEDEDEDEDASSTLSAQDIVTAFTDASLADSATSLVTEEEIEAYEERQEAAAEAAATTTTTNVVSSNELPSDNTGVTTTGTESDGTMTTNQLVLPTITTTGSESDGTTTTNQLALPTIDSTSTGGVIAPETGGSDAASQLFPIN